MKLPISWIRDYVDIDDIPLEDLVAKLTMSGTKIESFKRVGSNLENVFTGKIENIANHPNADKLLICQVDIGSGAFIQIVTGAQNVSKGDIVPVALVGAVLPNGIKIKKSKLRGEESCGMICSGYELGVEESCADGILILDPHTQIGKDIKDVMGLSNDVIIDCELTPNRPDCLSVIGICREVAATFDRQFKCPSYKRTAKINDSNIDDYLSVEVIENCNRYCARVIKNVVVKESPKWLQDRLIYCGMRPVNNIVDITNYVMLEYGQPLHAFDHEKLTTVEKNQKKIIVRMAQKNEQLLTLDGILRDLNQDTLVIADSERPIAIAGMLGGHESEISSETRTIILESANFNKYTIAQGSRSLGLKNESSIRFEKHLDIKTSLEALDKACQLIDELGVGNVVDDRIDIQNSTQKLVELNINYEKIRQLLGINLTEKEIDKILNRVFIDVNNGVAKIPSFRGDISIQEDLAEEVARIFGYDNIPEIPYKCSLKLPKIEIGREIREKITEYLVAEKFCQIITCPFSNSKELEYTETIESNGSHESNGSKIIRSKPVKIKNPLTEDQNLMQFSAIPAMLRCIKNNLNRKNTDLCLFEIAKSYQNVELSLREIDIVCIAMYGDYDFFDLKRIVDGIFEEYKISCRSTERIEYENKIFDANQASKIIVGNDVIVQFGLINAKLQADYDISINSNNSKVFICEIDLELLKKHLSRNIKTSSEKKFKELPKYPAITRDLAIVTDSKIMNKDIELAAKKVCSKLKIVESFQLFDVYEDEKLGKNKKSMAYSVVFRAPDRTLTDVDADNAISEILKGIGQRHDVKLRG